MRVLVAGASGVIGLPLAARLARDGHEVFGTSRTDQGCAQIEETGANAVQCNVFDPSSLARGMRQSRPEAVVHQLTALPGRINPRRARRDLGPTGRLRREGTKVLAAAAEAVGAKRFVFQSMSFVVAPSSRVCDETSPLYLNGSGYTKEVVSAIAEGEKIALSSSMKAVVLRYGVFYGPRTVFASDGTFTADVKNRRVPLVGKARAQTAFVHIEDAVEATVLALSHGKGIYNVAEDPVRVNTWLPTFAQHLGAKAPRRIPRWLAWVGAGPYGVYWMDELPAVTSAKARQELTWAPQHTWCEPPVLGCA